MKENDKCDKCGNGVIGIKNGQHGAFLACDQWPQCKNTQALTKAGVHKEADEVVKTWTPTASGSSSYESPKPINKHTAMYVSYVKDLVINGMDAPLAIEVIKSAIKELS